MISRDLAVTLRDAGLTWRPAAGDRFAIPQPELSDAVFTLSDMTIEAHEYAGGTVLGFNGTTEWALDSVTLDEALWLPREDQLRELLGGTFAGMDRTDTGYRVRLQHADGQDETHTSDVAADAYALALVGLISRSN